VDKKLKAESSELILQTLQTFWRHAKKLVKDFSEFK